MVSVFAGCTGARVRISAVERARVFACAGRLLCRRCGRASVRSAEPSFQRSHARECRQSDAHVSHCARSAEEPPLVDVLLYNLSYAVRPAEHRRAIREVPLRLRRECNTPNPKEP